MLLAPHPRGHVAVAQPAHGWMCGQLARAWGNERFGAVEPFEEVCLAAEQHDTDWAGWELEPTLDDAGLPHTFATAPFTVHLGLHTTGPRLVAMQSRYAAVLVALHHRSFFPEPGPLGRVRAGGRRIQEFLDDNAALLAELRPTLEATDAEIARNQRLVRTWDGLSHDLVLGLAPRTRPDVPTAGDPVELRIERRSSAHVVEPWPFAHDRVVVRTEGRLLEGTFDRVEAMRAALAAAPWVELSYELRPA